MTLAGWGLVARFPLGRGSSGVGVWPGNKVIRLITSAKREGMETGWEEDMEG